MIEIGYSTRRGRNRKTNEDSYFVDAEAGLFIVADGIGGDQAGEVASKMVIQEIVSSLRAMKSFPFSGGVGKLKDEQGLIKRWVQKTIERTNQKIYGLALQREEYHGMGSTVVLAQIVGNHVYIASIGDSRAYLIRNGKITQLTEDDSMVNELIKKGEIKVEEARVHPLRHVLTKAVGKAQDTKASLCRIPWKKDDYLLLCTDGLTAVMKDTPIRDLILQEKEPSPSCKRLVELAHQAGEDDITVILVHKT